MKPGRARVKSGIDAAEKDLEVWRDQVGHGFPVRTLEIFSAGTPELEVALHIRGDDHFMQRTSRGRYVKC